MNTFSVRRFKFRRGAVSLCATAVALCVACGGDDKGGDGGGGGGTGGEPVPARNGSRIGWSQAAASQSDIQSMTFRVYVDDNALELADVTCGTASSGGNYSCSGRLPNMSTGRHSIEITALLNTVESARSAPLLIVISGSTQTAPSQSDQTDSTDPSDTSSTLCLSEPAQCYNAQVVGSGLAQPRALSVMEDGRLLFIENASTVRVIDGNTLVPEPALTAPDPSGRIVGLAVDRSPNGDSAVFVAWTQPGADGPRLNITRYRELQNVLGQPATIVSGLPVPENAQAPLAVDSDGLLYVALPAVNPPDTGAILRFTRDGLVPQANERPSPIIAQSFSRTTGLAIDTARHRVWISGDQASWPYSFATLSLGSDAVAMWPQQPQSGLQSARAEVEIKGSSPSSLSLLRSLDTERVQWLMVGTDGQISRGVLTEDGRVEALGPVTIAPPIRVQSAVQGTPESWYFVTGERGAPASILRLTRR